MRSPAFRQNSVLVLSPVFVYELSAFIPLPVLQDFRFVSDSLWGELQGKTARAVLGNKMKKAKEKLEEKKDVEKLFKRCSEVLKMNLDRRSCFHTEV